MNDKLKPEAGGSSRAQTQGAAVKYSMFWHLMGHFDIWTQQWKVCERQQRWAEQHTQDVVRSPRLAWAGARAGASKWNRQVRKRHRQTWRPQMFFIIGCEMPAWDGDHPQDGGSGLQSPATAAQKTIHRRRHAGDGEEPGRGDTGQQSRTGQIVPAARDGGACLCLAVCEERRWTSFEFPRSMQHKSAAGGKTLTRWTSDSWQKCSENTSARHHTHKYTHTQNTNVQRTNLPPYYFCASLKAAHHCFTSSPSW